MSTSRRMLLLPAVSVLLLTSSPAGAGPAANPCAVAELSAMTRKLAAKVKCYQKALKKNAMLDDACLAAAEAKFATDVKAAEAKGACLITGDDSALLEKVADACFSTFVATQPDLQVCLPVDAPCTFECCPGLNCIDDPNLGQTCH